MLVVANVTNVLFINLLGMRPRQANNKTMVYLTKTSRMLLGIKHEASIYHTGVRVKNKQ